MERDSVIIFKLFLTVFLIFSKGRITLPTTTTALHFNMNKILIKAVNEINVFS